MRLRPVGRPSEITAVDTQLLRKLQENDAYSYLLQNRTGLDKQTVTSALKKLVSAKFIRGRAGRTSRNRHATFYSLHPLARELLDLNFDVGCHILRETLILERRYPKAPWRALFANSVKLYEFGHGVTLPTRKDSGIDKAVRFFHLQFLPGPPLPSDNILLNKRPPVSLEEAV